MHDSVLDLLVIFVIHYFVFDYLTSISGFLATIENAESVHNNANLKLGSGGWVGRVIYKLFGGARTGRVRRKET